MRGGRIHASGLVLGAALAAVAAHPVDVAAQSEPVVFEEFKAARARYVAPDDLPSAEDEPEMFFRTSFGLRATFRLGEQSNGVDLRTEAIDVSFGRFAASIGAQRDVSDDDGGTSLRYSPRDLNHIRRLVLKKTASGFRLRMRATRLSIPPPDRFTIQIGDDIGQLDVRTRRAVAPDSIVQGVVIVPRPRTSAADTIVRAECDGGTCRRSTDDQGYFAVESAAGERLLAVDAPNRTIGVLSQVVRRTRVRPGTTDVGLLVLPELATPVELVVPAGQQTVGVVLTYPVAGSPPTTFMISAGALLENADAGGDPAAAIRLSLAPIAPDLLPVAPPAGVAAATVWTVEPAGARVTPCADVVVPNPNAELADGALVEVYVLSRDTGVWTVSGSGVVQDGGTTIRAPGALCELTSFFVPCAPAITTIEASVTFRDAPIARVPIFVAGRSALTYPADRNRINLRVPFVSAGCAAAPDTLTAYAVLPLPGGYGYLAGASAATPAVDGGQTRLGKIALSLCGDGHADGTEECDGTDLRAQSCGTLGFQDGDLACTPTCTLDRTDCRTCGDGVLDPGEECDGEDDALCAGGCGSTCACPPVCGDGVRNQASESCDGTDDVLCPDACNAACDCPLPPSTTTTLPPATCPLAFELTPRSRARSASGHTGFEVGFSGLGHDRDIAGGHPISVGVECQMLEPPCGECTITGLAPVRGRCVNDPARVCDALNAPDPEQCDGERCDVFFLPPSHNMWGGGPSCFVERFTGDVGGSIDNRTGESRLSIDLASDLYFGVGAGQPCPICADDPFANDGFLEGKCVGGASDGLACDANGDDPTFGATSFDCLPGLGMLGASVPLTRHLELDSDGVEFPFNVPCDFPADDHACACAVCAGDTSIACAGDQDCVDAGTTGPCAGRGAGALRKPNTCEDYACTAVGDGFYGQCTTGPNESFCDGVLFTHGTPFLPCLSNGDCHASGDACGGDCGECTVTKRRSCFLDPILSAGFATPNLAVLSDVICLAPGVSPALDQVGGMPGPERVTIEMGLRRLFELTFDELPRGKPRRSER